MAEDEQGGEVVEQLSSNSLEGGAAMLSPSYGGTSMALLGQ